MSYPSFTSEDGWVRFRKPVYGEPTDSLFLTYFPEAGFLAADDYRKVDNELELLSLLSKKENDRRLLRSFVIVTFGSRSGDAAEMKMLLLDYARPSLHFDLTSNYAVAALNVSSDLYPPAVEPVSREIWYRPNCWWVKPVRRTKDLRSFEMPGFTVPKDG